VPGACTVAQESYSDNGRSNSCCRHGNGCTYSKHNPVTVRRLYDSHNCASIEYDHRL
jgi:hypothetical protein